jgi:hypothetical protein
MANLAALGAVFDRVDRSISLLGVADGELMTMNFTIESLFECCLDNGLLLADSGMAEGTTDVRVVHTEDGGFELDVGFVKNGHLLSWRRGEEFLLEMFADQGVKIPNTLASDLSSQLLDGLEEAAEDEDEPETVH